VDALFEQLFHGDPADEAIYFEIGGDQAFIQDILHGDVRSEGVGLGMLIAVQLDRRDEHDRLWRFAKASLEQQQGASRGYFRSTCGDGPCADPYGHQELAMALLFAHGRWGSRGGDIDYGSEAWRLMNVMWQKEQENGGVVAGVTNLLDAQTSLVVDQPTPSRSKFTRPSHVKPAYYALWAEATGEARWATAASAGRQLLEAAAHPTTGLMPSVCGFDGEPSPDANGTTPDGLRTQLNMTLDQLFHRPAAFYEGESDALIAFFAGQGITSYGSRYSLDGSVTLDPTRSHAIVAMNGVSALIATRDDRQAFVQAVWELPPPTGAARYYDGMLQLLSLLTLSGKMRVF
jgi:oligosaccharide reducing-end xylanase